MSEFDEYIVHGEPGQKEKADAWQTAIDLREAIEYDLSREKEFDYLNRPMTKIIKHLSQFIADLWQIHPFRCRMKVK